MWLGKRIRELRIESSVSQRELEEESGLARGYLSRVEDGSEVPSLETLEALADSLGVPLFQLFFDDHGPIATPHLTPHPTLDELVGVDLRQTPTGIHARRKGLLARITTLVVGGHRTDRSTGAEPAIPFRRSEGDSRDASTVTSQRGEPKLWP
ncbi:MAG: helix-turn-helix domain-containing protein [Terriglobia bacterium]